MYFFSFEEVLHSVYVGECGIEGIGVDFGVFSYRGEQVYVSVFEHLQELDCSVQSFAPWMQILKFFAHFSWIVSECCISLSDMADCLPIAKPSKMPPTSRMIV